MNPQIPGLSVPFDKTTGVLCEACDNNIFTEALLLRKVSRFVSATDKDQLIYVPVLMCVKCQHVNKDMLPAALQQSTDDDNDSD